MWSLGSPRGPLITAFQGWGCRQARFRDQIELLTLVQEVLDQTDHLTTVCATFYSLFHRDCQALPEKRARLEMWDPWYEFPGGYGRWGE